MSSGFHELEGLRVVINGVVFSPDYETPPDRPFAFVYAITIHNDSTETVTIKGRKWVVTESDGSRFVVEGEGVVGEFPRLGPGDRFSYKSYMTVATNSYAEGAYLGLTEEDRPVLTRIPRFEMRIPQ